MLGGKDWRLAIINLNISLNIKALTTAYLLVAHGSSDPRSQIGLARLVHLVRQKLCDRLVLAVPNRVSTAVIPRSPLVASAVLEKGDRSLAEQIVQFASQAAARGDRQIVLLPLLLSRGIHLQEDIPAALALSQSQVDSDLQFNLYPHLGGNAGMAKLLAQRFKTLPHAHRILVAHGTKRREGQQELTVLAQSLGAEIANWSVAPSLGDRIELAVRQGHRQFAIQPYFLFAGGITDAIAQQVHHLASIYPRGQFYLGDPLGAIAPLADLMVEAMLYE
jgi:sirohydrochlorin cobaltochelatase